MFNLLSSFTVLAGNYENEVRIVGVESENCIYCHLSSFKINKLPSRWARISWDGNFETNTLA
jgi:hypothetical protein